MFQGRSIGVAQYLAKVSLNHVNEIWTDNVSILYPILCTFGHSAESFLIQLKLLAYSHIGLLVLL